MKFQKRLGVFESNSSSTHSMTMCLKEDYEKFKNGEMFLDYWSDELITKEEIVKRMEQDCLEGYDYVYDKNKSLEENFDIMVDKNLVDESDYDNIDDFLYNRIEIKTYEKWNSGSDLEGFYDEFKLPNGDIVVAFGEYGYNG